jgi:hypothetical protein
MHESHGELAVIGQQEQAATLLVEPADWKEALGRVEPIRDGRTASRIADAGQDAGRLIHHHVGVLAGKPEQSAIESHPIRLGINLLPRVCENPVDGNTAVHDQLICLAPRSHAGAG